MTGAIKRALLLGRVPISDKESQRINKLYDARAVATQYLEAMSLG